MLHPVEITLEAQTKGIRVFVVRPLSRSHRTGRARRQRGVERSLPLFPALHPPPDERLTRRDAPAARDHGPTAHTEGTDAL